MGLSGSIPKLTDCKPSYGIIPVSPSTCFPPLFSTKTLPHANEIPSESTVLKESCLRCSRFLSISLLPGWMLVPSVYVRPDKVKSLEYVICYYFKTLPDRFEDNTVKKNLWLKNFKLSSLRIRRKWSSGYSSFVDVVSSLVFYLVTPSLSLRHVHRMMNSFFYEKKVITP